MSEQDSVYQSLKELEVMDLISKKTSAIKELDKIVKQQLSGLDVTKNSERSKMGKMLEKVQAQLHLITVVDQLLKEKDF